MDLATLTIVHQKERELEAIEDYLAKVDWARLTEERKQLAAELEKAKPTESQLLTYNKARTQNIQRKLKGLPPIPWPGGTIAVEAWYRKRRTIEPRILDLEKAIQRHKDLERRQLELKEEISLLRGTGAPKPAETAQGKAVGATVAPAANTEPSAPTAKEAAERQPATTSKGELAKPTEKNWSKGPIRTALEEKLKEDPEWSPTVRRLTNFMRDHPDWNRDTVERTFRRLIRKRKTKGS